MINFFSVSEVTAFEAVNEAQIERLCALVKLALPVILGYY
jgi:hypothetical protein